MENSVESDSIEDIKNKIFSREVPSIKNKFEFYKLYENGFFGNKVETASSYEEIIEKKWEGYVSIRSKDKRIKRNRVSYLIPIEKIPEELKKWKDFGISKDEIIFNKNPPDDKLIFQGEIMLSYQGVHLVYSTIKKPMNLALKEEEKVLTGLLAINLLKENLTPPSFEDIMDLLKLFPSDVIEFSCYDILVGTLNNRNTII